jgi:hypothetical protein
MVEPDASHSHAQKTSAWPRCALNRLWLRHATRRVAVCGRPWLSVVARISAGGSVSGHLLVNLARDDPEPVVLNFVQPCIAGGRLGCIGGKAMAGMKPAGRAREGGQARAAKLTQGGAEQDRTTCHGGALAGCEGSGKGRSWGAVSELSIISNANASTPAQTPADRAAGLADRGSSHALAKN